MRRRKPDARPETKRELTQKAYPILGLCEGGCGRMAVDRHHRNGDTGNSHRANIRLLCRTCHMIEDGRMSRRDGRGRFARYPQPR